jgi:hypothetical protein
MCDDDDDDDDCCKSALFLGVIVIGVTTSQRVVSQSIALHARGRDGTRL